MFSKITTPINTDIVTVPDFSNERRVAFVLRTLFFLASWEANAPLARKNCLMHIASIGEIPTSVRVLAEEVGATIHVFEPLRIGKCFSVNKLRGLQIAPETRKSERFLLLDADIFFVSDPSPFLESLSPEIIAAAPANKIVFEHYWKRIYNALNIAPPDERIQLLSVEVGLHQGPFIRGHGSRATDMRALRPFWNSGVLLCPWSAPLGELWAKNLALIFQEFAPARNGFEKALFLLTDNARFRPRRVVSNCDQAGLATAIQMLKPLGYSFQRLPNALHIHSLHFQSGVSRFEEASIWHGTSFGRGIDSWGQAESHVREYSVKIDKLLDEGAHRRGEQKPSSTVVQEFMEKIWKRVAPLVEKHPVD